MKTHIVTTHNGVKCLREKNPFGKERPTDAWPRGDDAVWEHDTVLSMKSKRREWEQFEQSVTYTPIAFDAEEGAEYSGDEVYLDRFCENEEWITAYRLTSKDVEGGKVAYNQADLDQFDKIRKGIEELKPFLQNYDEIMRELDKNDPRINPSNYGNFICTIG